VHQGSTPESEMTARISLRKYGKPRATLRGREASFINDGLRKE
jgi:hypothetical protein